MGDGGQHNGRPGLGGDLDSIEPQLANILWRWTGVRAVPHLPCQFVCPVTISLGEHMLDVAAGAGYGEEAGWIREVLSWPSSGQAFTGSPKSRRPC